MLLWLLQMNSFGLGDVRVSVLVCFRGVDVAGCLALVVAHVIVISCLVLGDVVG